MKIHGNHWISWFLVIFKNYLFYKHVQPTPSRSHKHSSRRTSPERANAYKYSSRAQNIHRAHKSWGWSGRSRMKVFEKLVKIEKSSKIMKLHWFSLILIIFDHFWWFPMRPMLLTWPAPTHVMHHPSSQIVPRHETIEAQAFQWCLGIKIGPVVIKWRPNVFFWFSWFCPFFVI